MYTCIDLYPSMDFRVIILKVWIADTCKIFPKNLPRRYSRCSHPRKLRVDTRRHWRFLCACKHIYPYVYIVRHT